MGRGRAASGRDAPLPPPVAEGGLAPWQIWGYASQHYRLVGSFTAYPKAIAGRTPNLEVRRLLRDILEDEYMRPQAFERSHPALSRRSMRAVGFAEGAWDRVPALPATRGFISMHLDMTFRSWVEALGAVGPGHEWAIPRMFPYLVQGIERSVAIPFGDVGVLPPPHRSRRGAWPGAGGGPAPVGHD